MRALYVLAICALIAVPSLQADEVTDYGNIIVTVHDQPVADICSLVRPPAPRKIDKAADWLVLPRFRVDTTNVNGLNTLFAVRNVTDGTRELSIRYNSDGGGSVADFVTLGPKEVKSVNLRDVSGLATDTAGIAAGYVHIIDSEAISIFPASVIQGDYFLVDPENNFASGDRLLNYTNFDAFIDMCSKYEIRFFNGGAFAGGAEVTIFIETLQAGHDFAYSVYTESGTLARTGTVVMSNNSTHFPAGFLAGTTEFGVIEIVFNGTYGHVSSVFSAQGRFSVGLNGSCEGQIIQE